MNVYIGNISVLLNGEKIHSDTTGLIFSEDKPSDIHEEYTWDNIDTLKDTWRLYWIGVTKKRKGFVVKVYNYLCDGLKGIYKEWKGDTLNITYIMEYKDASDRVSISEILNHRDSNASIKYLVERGMNIMDMKGS